MAYAEFDGHAAVAVAAGYVQPCTYCSTRGGERGLPFERVLLAAYAADGGLFVPERLPHLSTATLRSWAPLSMAQVCARVMALFTDLDLPTCERLASAAFASASSAAWVAIRLAMIIARTATRTLAQPSLPASGDGF